MAKNVVQVYLSLAELFTLMFADDLVLLSSTLMGLQIQMNCLITSCQEVGVEINSERERECVRLFLRGRTGDQGLADNIVFLTEPQLTVDCGPDFS